MSNAGMRTVGPSCGCEGSNCITDSDDFNRADETIDGPPAPFTNNWSGQPDSTWSVSGNRLYSVGSGSDLARAVRHVDIPVRVEVSVDIEITTAGDTAGIVLSYSSPSLIRRLGAVIEAASSGCGELRFYDYASSLTSPTTLGVPVKVDGLVAGETVRLHLCYDSDTRLLSSRVEIGGTTVAYNHVKNQAIAAEADITTRLAWLINPDGTGGVYFDNFSVQEKVVTSYYLYYYDGNRCPCCSGRRDCNPIAPAADDCRWLTTGTWTDYAASSSGARKELQASWSGINSSCEPDATTMVKATVEGATDGSEIVMYIDGLGVKLTLDSSAGAGDGTLTLIDSGETVTLTGADINTPIQLCLQFDGSELVATALGEMVAADETAASPDTGGRVVIGSDTSGDVTFSSVSIGHDIYSVSCPDCVSGTRTDSCGGTHVCAGGEMPMTLLARVEGIDYGPTGYVDEPWVCRENWCAETTGTYLLRIGATSTFVSDLTGYSNVCGESDGTYDGDQCTIGWTSTTEKQCLVNDPPLIIIWNLSRTVTVSLLKLTEGYVLVGTVEVDLDDVGVGSCNSVIGYKSAVLSSDPFDCVNGFAEDITLNEVCRAAPGGDPECICFPTIDGTYSPTSKIIVRRP